MIRKNERIFAPHYRSSRCDEILKEYPELNRKNFHRSARCCEGDTFADDDKATNFNKHLSRIVNLQKK